MIQYEPGQDGIEGFVATGTAIALAIAGAASAGTSIYAAKKQSDTALKGAQLQTDASNRAADLQTQSAKDALDFQKQQAAQDLVTHNATAKGNYDQWAARERRISSLGSALGMAPRDIPGFQPTPGADGAPTGGGPPAQGGPPAGPAPPPNASPDDIGHFVASYFASRGVQPQPTSVEYFVRKWPELVARGQELGDPTYPMKRLAAADEFGGGGQSGGAGTLGGSARAPWSQYQQTVTGPYTPRLQTPQPGTLASYARG